MPERFLLIRLTSLGDVLLTTPCIKAIRDKYPDAWIDFIVDKKSVIAIENNPHISRLIVFPQRHWDREWKKGNISFFRMIKKIREFLKQVKSQPKYDYAIDFHGEFWSALLLQKAKAEIKAGPSHQLLNLFGVKRIKQKKIHTVFRNHELIKDIAENIQTVPVFVPAKGSLCELENNLSEKNLNINNAKNWILLNPCTTRQSKSWHNDRWAKLADRIISRLNMLPVFLPGPDEEGFIDSIMCKMKHPDKSASLLLDFSQRFHLYEKSRMLITVDSGPMHLAGATNLPIIAIFGPTSPFKWGVVRKDFFPMYKELECSPCNEVKGCENLDCMLQITVDEVFEQIIFINEFIEW